MGSCPTTAQSSIGSLCVLKEKAPMTILFDEIYVASTLKELQYRDMKVEPGLTEDELRTVERTVGSPLPPDLALLLRTGLPSGEDFPDWRGNPDGEMRRA